MRRKRGGEEGESEVVRKKKGGEEEVVVGWRREWKTVIYKQAMEGSSPFGSPATRSVAIQNCRGEGERYKYLAHCTMPTVSYTVEGRERGTSILHTAPSPQFLTLQHIYCQNLIKPYPNWE